jgi:hypothetical protein
MHFEGFHRESMLVKGRYVTVGVVASLASEVKAADIAEKP